MNKQQLTERLARQSHRSRGQAADTVDSLVYRILKDIRTAERAPEPSVSKAPVDPAITGEGEKS